MKLLLKHIKNNLFWYLVLSITVLSAVSPELLIAFLGVGVVILFAKNITSKSSNESEISIGKRGGRYEMRISEKTGKPYRHYF